MWKRVWSNKSIHGEFEPELCCDLLLEFNGLSAVGK
jgi:hypothetical protein